MGRGCDDHGGIANRECSANESTQHVKQEAVVGIQLNDVAIMIMAGRLG
jgi:hypothetical protein